MSARLSGARIGVLMESDFYEPEIFYYQRRFAEEGAEVRFLSRLWGQRSLTFHGHEFQAPFTVTGSVEQISDAELDGYHALIVPAGMVADRLRYTEDVDELSPAADLLRRAFARPGLVKGVICHGLWLLSSAPYLVRGRKVVCHNNLIGDVRNMGANYVDQDVVVDGDLVTARTGDDCAAFAHTVITMVEDRLFRPEPAAPAAAVVAPSVTAAPAALPARPLDPTPVDRGGVTPYSDLITGSVGRYDRDAETFTLTTSEGREYAVRLDSEPRARLLRNLDEPERDLTTPLDRLLRPGRPALVHGLFYPEDEGTRFDAKDILLPGTEAEEYRFEEPDWWVRQLEAIARFYRRAQFGDGPIDFRDYRTAIRLGGDKGASHVQETDTISRLVYGMATAYLLTGKDEYLEVAEKGTAYLRDHMRFVDTDEDVVYWFHGIRVDGAAERQLLTSEFADDYRAVPMYEQIYALAGPVQTYRITGDRRIRSDVEATLRLFERFFADPVHGGYFSHVDPILLRPDHSSLGENASRKNWNSVGDHAPAYLINYYLATGDPRLAAMLEDTQDTVAARFPDAGSAFVQERFHADWTPDAGQSWQRDRAVVGHNLKIAWNLTRVGALRPKRDYAELAERIGHTMPELGSDRQRGGWYDVVERQRRPGERRHRFAWHDRKAWWQQEQAILAYLIMHGTTGEPRFLAEARRAQSFYNAFFLDHDEGGVYFNVAAAGLPYLLGTERLKGSHSMSMYHSAELCYLAAVYNNLLIAGKPMTLHFKPEAAALPGRVLRVSPDLLPAGRVRIGHVTVDGREHTDFDAQALTVHLPDVPGRVKVKVRIDPVGTAAGERRSGER
ncbi:AGE family epimerase/isomerase [Actinospica robiniae]|uniref:AGE family epimerase/isomerase n=1 Tax=Actinospica robiniae TaxID=304901 RepID=UPI0004255E6C|nr:AGE family epimerase/isomerase [Actinospica robiniae]